MAQIKFKAKVRNVYNPDESLSHRIIEFPTFARSHCDMAAFRRHPKFGGLANSDLFANVLARIRRDVTNGRGWIKLDQVPASVSVDESGFLAIVTIDA